MQEDSIDIAIKRVSGYFRNPLVKGVLPLVMVVLAMAWANSPFEDSYFHLLEPEFTMGFEGFVLAKPLHNVSIETRRAGTPLQRAEYLLSPAVNFLILPLVILANAGVRITEDFFAMPMHSISVGSIVGLAAGKFVGISLFSRTLVSTGLGELPENVNWPRIYGIGMLAGIGFTMSLFIAELALTDPYVLNIAKVGILTASILSAILGLFWFRIFTNRNRRNIAVQKSKLARGKPMRRKKEIQF